MCLPFLPLPLFPSRCIWPQAWWPPTPPGFDLRLGHKPSCWNSACVAHRCAHACRPCIPFQPLRSKGLLRDGWAHLGGCRAQMADSPRAVTATLGALMPPATCWLENSTASPSPALTRTRLSLPLGCVAVDLPRLHPRAIPNRGAFGFLAGQLCRLARAVLEARRQRSDLCQLSPTGIASQLAHRHLTCPEGRRAC
jgi:hypothetical protein